LRGGVISSRPPRSAPPLLGDGALPDLARRAFFLVDDFDAAPISWKRSVPGAFAAGGTGLRDHFAPEGDHAGRKLRGVAVRVTRKRSGPLERAKIASVALARAGRHGLPARERYDIGADLRFRA